MTGTSTVLRVVAFVAALLAVGAAALGVGRAVGPVDGVPLASEAGAEPDHGHDADASGDSPADGAADGAADKPVDVPGLTARADGFTLELADPTLPAGPATLELTIRTSSGRPLLDYDVAHEKELHLIVVRRDLVGFQHVHPVLDRRTGTWSVEVDLTPGTWRVIADFVPEGWQQVTLAEDLAVSGRFQPAPPGQERLTDVVDGYRVTLAGDTAPGAPTELTARIERDGVGVRDLQPYLGAYGHLVALRAGDLGYLHVHPEGQVGTAGEGGGPEIRFATEFPTAGTYRLFLDFRVGNTVHTADFTVTADGAPADSGTSDETGSPDEHQEDSHDH
ncbi:hypothetical protein [Nocardioides campestrisoli]|uniref:hypothetical protein n=1 Tax=Nocardioides campestrisoli TaxID=2736757 RepID=UPI0015E769F0|nr:hypothetical protein [Nocardioides campestrisoli]